MNKLRKFDDWLLIVCIVLSGVLIVANLTVGKNPLSLTLSAFSGGASVSAIFFNHLHKKAMKLCDEWHEQAKKAQELAFKAVLQSITVMGQQIDRYKRGE